MNLVLFEPDELASALPLDDPRAQHILKVLRLAPGASFDAGLVNGPIGKATLLRSGSDSLEISFIASREPPPLPPVTLLVGLPRPQTARDLLRDTATLGAACIHFVTTERSDPNYAASSLWTSGEWQRHLLVGAAQAFDTRLPLVTWTHSLAASFALLPNATARLALDNYEATRPLASALAAASGPDLVLAIGPERGWGATDREALRAAGFSLAHLGTRVLRTETALVAALALAAAAREA